jgi:hypothetical protein
MTEVICGGGSNDLRSFVIPCLDYNPGNWGTIDPFNGSGDIELSLSLECELTFRKGEVVNTLGLDSGDNIEYVGSRGKRGSIVRNRGR